MTKVYFKVLLHILALLFLSSCQHDRNLCIPTEKVETLPNYYSADFLYPNNSNELQKKVISETCKFTTTEYSFKSTHDLLHPNEEPHQIIFEVYHPSTVKRDTTVLCLPISGGNYLVSRYFAKYFATQGFTSVVIHRRQAYKHMITVDNLNTIIRQMIIEHKQVMDKLQEMKVS